MNNVQLLYKRITDFLFGKKYYANVVYMTGTTELMLSSFIFRTRKEAERHRDELKGNMTYNYDHTISFRSRHMC